MNPYGFGGEAEIFFHMIELGQFETETALAEAVARRWIEQVETSACRTVALSGGRIARDLFKAAARIGSDRAEAIRGIHFFWADERCVGPEDPESNFGMARQLLFEPLNIPPTQLHRIRGELDPEFAATEAEAEICRLAPLSSEGQPTLDLVLLGMGEDGHIASLFPGEPESLMGSSAAYRAVRAPKPPPRRISLNYGTLAAARSVWVLVSGSGKGTAWKKSFESGSEGTPLGRLLALRERTDVFVMGDVLGGE